MDIADQTKDNMEKSVESLAGEFAGVRSGMAHPSLIENLNVEAYGSKMPLSSMASISSQDATTLSVQVWDQANVGAVDKAIRSSQLSLNPRVEGAKLFLSFPPITTERRKELVKIVRQKSEERKVSIRNLRRLANEKLKEKEKSGEFGEDELNQYLKKIQNLTDRYITKIDEMLEKKDKDISSI